mmetsp:Transcript_26249/g.75712  ORF Transcript_26249/g.75712 Transcript_26249/m.75712 type:complete len:142 (+) Transcript_26249:602-1027(+)
MTPMMTTDLAAVAVECIDRPVVETLSMMWKTGSWKAKNGIDREVVEDILVGAVQPVKLTSMMKFLTSWPMTMMSVCQLIEMNSLIELIVQVTGLVLAEESEALIVLQIQSLKWRRERRECEQENGGKNRLWSLSANENGEN